MKHLGVLENAHLIVTRRIGREKRHYLNPLPIQEIADRWIARYAQPFLRTMSDLKTAVEGKDAAMAPQHRSMSGTLHSRHAACGVDNPDR